MPKMKLWILLWAWAGLILGLTAASQISIDPDGGYKGIVIQIQKNVPEEKCPQILSNLKALLREASKGLYQALDERAFFKSVTIVVPSSWRDAKCQSIIRPPKGGTPYRHADIRVATSDPVYGHQPFTQQTGGCGHPGDLMTLPYTYVSAWNHSWEQFGDPSKLFVKEWAKLRYGIFDEFGFIGDAMYPSYYHLNGHIMPTGTSDIPLGGVWINMMTGHTGCNPSSEPNCLFYPNEKQMQDVTCSLANLHFLPNVTRFCGASKDIVAGPTKHNVLCEGRSSLEVINAHQDFAKQKQITTSNIEPIFEVVREPLEQYVLVMETSSSMDNQGQWKWINKAAQKFIRYDLPVNSNLAIVTFSNDSKVEHNMVQVHSDQVRARLADAIPDKYHLSRSDKRCVLCAMQKVIHEVVSDHQAGTHIVLVTRGGSDTLSLTDENILRGHILDYNIKLSAILLPDSGTNNYLAFYDQITHLMGAKSHVVHSDKNIMDFYVSFNEAFADVWHSDARYPTEIPEMVHQEAFLGDSGITTGNFLIDSTLGRDTQFGIYVEDEEDHLIKSIRFTDSKGKTYGPFLRMSSDFDLVNFKTINFPAGQSPPFSAPNQIGMTWQYTIEWHSGQVSALSNSNRKSIVIVTSKPRSQTESTLIKVKTWTSQQSNILFAQVLRGDSPVIGAKVMASVMLESSNNDSLVTLSPVRLHDNGYGDPDIVSGDGIYSRYLGRYSDPGRYRFTVSVDDNDNTAYYIEESNEVNKPPLSASNRTKINYADLYYTAESHRTCCGSTVQVDPDRRVKTGKFVRSVIGPVVFLDKPAKASDDNVPPSRIGDLKIRQLPGARTPDRLLAEWTAPGGDYDSGSVAGYRFVFSSKIDDLLSQTNDPEVLLGFKQMERSGTPAKFDFNFPHFDKDFYVGAYAFDIVGNRGKLSNLVHVRIPGPVQTREEAEPISAQPEEDQFNWMIIAITGGVVLVLIIMAVATIAYYIYVSKAKKSIKTGSTSSVMGGANSDETDSSSFDSDIKNIMSNPLGPALALPRQAMPTHGTTPTTQITPTDTNSTNVTPVYWSASQLLSKLDQKSYNYYVPQGPQSLQQLHHQAGQHAVAPAGHHAGQPVSLHNMSYEGRGYPSWSYRSQNIPEEYTITVEDTSNSALGPVSASASVGQPAASADARTNRKVPPPVMPKPRNITQV